MHFPACDRRGVGDGRRVQAMPFERGFRARCAHRRRRDGAERDADARQRAGAQHTADADGHCGDVERRARAELVEAGDEIDR